MWVALWSLSQWIYHDWYQFSRVEHPGAVGASITHILVSMAPYSWAIATVLTVLGIAVVFLSKNRISPSIIFWKSTIVLIIMIICIVIIGMKVSWSPWMNLRGLQY